MPALSAVRRPPASADAPEPPLARRALAAKAGAPTAPFVMRWRRALRLAGMRREAAIRRLLEDAHARALAAAAGTRRDGLLDLLHLLTVEDWPAGAQWRGRLVQLIVTVGPPLVARRGRKRRGATGERYAAIRAAHAALGAQGVRGQRRRDALLDRFGISPRTLDTALARARAGSQAIHTK